MKEVMENAVKEYQCSGCIKGAYPECYESDNGGSGCGAHYAGTGMLGGGLGYTKLFLGMPKGFNRLGDNENLRPRIFETYAQLSEEWEYDKFNRPVWKYLKDGHTFIRGISPRINAPFIHIVLEDCIGEINCMEITEDDINGMD